MIDRKAIARGVLALLMTTLAVLHFAVPQPFVDIVPAWLPSPLQLVYVSGAAELAGGLGVLFKPTRRAAGIGLVLLYIAVFPANVNMALHHLSMGGKTVSPLLLWGRLPFQALFMWWAWWSTR